MLPSATTAAATARARCVGVDRRDERAVELQEVERRARERRERRAAGAEVVGDDQRAERTQRGDGTPARASSPSALPESSSRRRDMREPGALGDLLHLARKRRVGDRREREVDVQAQVVVPCSASATARGLEHEPIEQRTERAIPDVGHEPARRDRTELGVAARGRAPRTPRPRPVATDTIGW